ncbi:MAG: Gfo/Idh/MocA family oxidoreductase [Fimbriimonadaceae bacterium]|nr:Gfo/Idh/MocA family oxidoreductase [Fimbriimonadaceae bacterium]
MQHIVLAGCGFMGRMHGSVYQILPNARLVGCVDRRDEKAARYAQDFGCEVFPSVEAALEQTDATVLDVCLPTDLHAEATLIGAKYGKHIICEKPMALSLDEADRMIAACDQAGVNLMIGHCIRYWPQYAKLKDIVDSGRLGRLQVLNLTRYGEFPSWATDNWQADEKRAGGGALDMRIHDTDYALYLLGEPKQMTSHGQVDERGVGYSITTMLYSGGTVVHLEGGWSWPPKTPFKMTIRAMFERGAVIMEDGPMTIYGLDGEPEVPEFPAMAVTGGGNISDLGGYFVEIKDFIDCLDSGSKPSVVTPQSSRQSLATALEEIRQIKARNAGA